MATSKVLEEGGLNRRSGDKNGIAVFVLATTGKTYTDYSADNLEKQREKIDNYKAKNHLNLSRSIDFIVEFNR